MAAVCVCVHVCGGKSYNYGWLSSVPVNHGTVNLCNYAIHTCICTVATAYIHVYSFNKTNVTDIKTV